MSLCDFWNLRGNADTMIVDGEYPLRNCENLPLPFQMELSKIWETFSEVFVPFLEFTSIFKHFEEKMIVIANVFPKLKSVKDWVRSLSKKRCFRTPFGSHHVKVSQTCVKSSWEHLYHIFSSLQEKLIWKISLSVICEIIGAFVDTLTVNDKYPVRNCENFHSQFRRNYLKS